MFFVKAALLAVIEGLTEFLPISSTGHMILTEHLLKLSEDPAFCKAFEVIIQFPAILSVVLYFWNDLWPFRRDPRERATRIALWMKVIVAFIPAAVLGFLFDDMIEARLFNPTTVMIALILGGLAFLAIERMHLAIHATTVTELSFGRALAIGFIQCLAMVPGVSRSGATILGGMCIGASRPLAAEFSFFLAVPTMAGATTLTLFKSGASFTPEQWLAIALGSVISFAVAYGVIAFLMRFVQRHTFDVFGYYRIALGLIILATKLF